MDNTFVNHPSVFNISEYGKNILNKLEATWKWACMENSWDKYYKELLRTITDFNNRNDVPLFNEKIQEAIHKVIVEEESDAHNVTADNFSQTPNTQRDNSNSILTSEKLDKLEEMTETLKDLTINNAEYYVSDSENVNDTKDNPASDTKTVTHTSDRKKRNVMDTSNRILTKIIE